jgi:Domain of Unknown Function with PDB structure (DUF3857)
MRNLLILICLLICQLAKSQYALPEFGEYSPEEINLKECAFDRKAEAVILLDAAIADHDDDYRLITHHRRRIKIFNQREIDQGNITIYFYSKDQFEYISNIKGVTYNLEGGQPVLTHLDSKSIYTEKENNIRSRIKFAMPNVKPGSIIEYEYDSYMKHYGGLDHWRFQHELPVIKSSYFLTVLPGREFQYSVQKKVSYPIIIKPMFDVGKIYFEMDNIPGLKFEPYMEAANDYLQRVEFQLASYTNSFGDKTKVVQTWKDLAYELLGEKEFGGAIKKDLPNLDEIKSIVSKETTDSGKLAVIYNYVRNNFTWNNFYSKYAGDGVKTPWEKRTGNAGEINLILLNLLQTFNVEASPILVAERDFGKIDTTYPFIDRFNKVAAYARINNKTYILDATEKFTPPGLIPYALLNTIGFVVDKKDFRLIRILNNKNAYQNNITVTAKIEDNGMLKGTADIVSSDYAKEKNTDHIKRNTKRFIKDLAEESANDPTIDKYTFENIDDDSKPLLQKLEFHTELNVNGGFVFVDPAFFAGLIKNPFTAEERFTNVNFGYPYDISVEATIQLPAKSKIDKLPENKNQAFGGQSLTILRQFKSENNTLVISLHFKQTLTVVQNDQYASLKSVYQSVIDLLNEPIVIKINN